MGRGRECGETDEVEMRAEGVMRAQACVGAEQHPGPCKKSQLDRRSYVGPRSWAEQD